MNEDELLGELRQAATPATPAGWKPGIVYQGRQPSEITTPPLPAMETETEFAQAVRDLGYPLPEGYTLMLVEMQMAQHEAFWRRDPVEREDGGKEGLGEAYTAPANSWRYRFKVVPLSSRHDEDLAALMVEAKNASHRLRVKATGSVTKVISLADFQTGKVDELGGTTELLARSEAALLEVREDLIQNPVDEIVILDAGDSTEGFESAPNADRTNDLSQTEQVRVWRRILWRWIEALAHLAPEVKVIGVPSNHCRVRRGKNNMGDALDDWGIEVISQVSDIAKVNPEAYGHVQFIIPEQHREHVVVTLIGGKALGLIHGHQSPRPDALPDLLKKNARNGIGQADIVVAGHFHHLRVVSWGYEQVLFVSPSNDGGSSWFQYSGEHSRAGVLTFRVDERGWRDLAPVWTD